MTIAIIFFLIAIVLFVLGILGVIHQRNQKYEMESYQEKNRQRIEKKQQEFKNLYETIKEVPVTISNAPTPKQLLKNMPIYNLSKIRKSTPVKKVNDFIVIDTETTGLKAGIDEIIEISAIKFIDGIPTECMTSLIKPKKDIPVEASNINHITMEMVKDAPRVELIMESFNNFIKGYNLVGHNLSFDLDFLYKNGMDLFGEKRFYYDTIDVAKSFYDKGEIYNYKLDTIAEDIGIYRPQAHRSSDDALATGLIFNKIGNYIINS